MRADPAAFERLVDPFRSELQAHCYRMLGSLHDAEDALQETLMRAWRGLARYDERGTPRAWLYKIATNCCLTTIERRRRRELPTDFGPDAAPLAETVWLEPYPDTALDYEARESVELAFVAALQHLPPKQRAVLILREVLRWRASEVAELLDTSVASVNSALQRARATLSETDTGAAPEPMGDEQRALLSRYVDAFERYDMDSLTSLLHDDAKWNMPPYELWLQTHLDIVKWCLGPGIGCRGSRLIPTMANGSPAFGQYKPSPDGGLAPWSLQVLEITDGRISDITFFLDTARFFPLFGLPDHLEA